MKLFRIVAAYFFIAGAYSVSAQSTWSQLGTDIEGGAGDGLGTTLSMSANGTIVAAGAPSADADGGSSSLRGLVKVYVLESGSWTQMGSTINGTEDGAAFGAAISMSDDGTLLAIGAPYSASSFAEFSNSGQVKIYSWNAGSSDWTLEETIEAEAAGDNFGYAISVSGDGSVIAIGAPFNDAGGDSRGRVRVYDWDGSLLSSREDLDGAADLDGFGTAVSLNLDGSVLAVGAPSKSGSGSELNVGQATTYSWNTNTYSNTGTLDGVAEYDTFGDEVSLSDDGTRLAVSVTKFFGGVTYVELFDFSSSWSSIGIINSANDTDGFGNSINLSGDGSHVAIGASSNATGSEGGRAEVYAYSGSAWEKVDTDILGDAENDGAGTAVGISADGAFVAVGAPANVGGGVNAGQVKVYELAVPDMDAPTVTITSEESNNTKNSPFAITITFSEEVTGFAVADIAVTNGAAGNFATSDNIIFTADITPAADGAVTVNIAADVAQDLSGNGNTAANEFSIVYDATAPDVVVDAITTNDQTPALTGTIDDNTATISVTVGEETNEATNNGDGTWTLPDNTLSSLDESEYTVSAIATDALGNQSSEVTAQLTIDLTGPQIFFDNGNLTGLASFTDPVSISPLIVNIFFTEETTGLTLGEITIDGNVGTTGLSEAEESGTAYYILAIPLQNPNINQEITITIPAGAAEDLAGNPNAEGSVTISYDVTGPSVNSISTIGYSTTNVSPIAVEIVFSEEITELAADDFTVVNGTITATPSSEDNITFTLEITPTNEGLVTIQLLTDVVQDLAGNYDIFGTGILEMTYDITAPDVDITTESENTAISPILATVTFSEAIDQLIIDDFTITNGTATSISTVDLGVYTLAVTPNAAAEGSTSTSGIEVTIALEPGKVQDAAGNSNTASNSLTVNFDDQAPVFNIFNDSSEPLTAVSGNFTANFTISESTSVFDIDDINVTNGNKSNFRSESVFGFTRYRVDIELTSSEGVTITIPAGAVTDAAGNANIETTFTIPVDIVGPTVTITTSTSSPTNVNPIPVTFTFNEKVMGFSSADIAANGFSVTSQPLSQDNITFTTKISPSVNGALTVALKNASVQDIAGNNNTNTGSLVITFDDTAPTLTISGPNGVNSTQAFQLKFTFSENVKGFTMADIAVTNGTKANFSGSDAVYTVTITPSGAGAVTVSVAEKAATDAAGNPNAAGAQKSVSFDNIRPTVAITGAPASPVNSKNPIKFTFTFSEAVTGFAQQDITVSNGTKANFAGSGAVYTADISPTEFGDVAISLAENIALDAAGNGNEAGSASFTYEQKYSGGSGTEADPYLIANKADLQYLSENRADWSYHFKQTANITFTPEDFSLGGSFYNNGKGFSPIGNYSTFFKGSYDGDGNTIEGLVINGDGGVSLVGLFGYTFPGSSLKNIALRNVDFKGLYASGALVAYNFATITNCSATGSVSGGNRGGVGGLIGNSFNDVTSSYAKCNVSGSTNVGGLIGENNGNVINSYGEGKVSGTSHVGGLIGNNQRGAISKSYATGIVTGQGENVGGLIGRAWLESAVANSYATGIVSGGDYVGGLIGDNGGPITDCYSTGHVSGNRGVGGLIGSHAAPMSNSYAIATVSGSSSVGGLTGIKWESSRISFTGTFWDKDLSGTEINLQPGPVGTNTTDMRKRETYANAGWDLSDTWIHVGQGYHPILKWQVEGAKPFTVSGKAVGKDGQPFSNGKAEAHFLNIPLVSVDLAADGSFKLENIPAYIHSIVVVPSSNDMEHVKTYYGDADRSALSRHVYNSMQGIQIKMIAKSDPNLLNGKGVVNGRVVRSASGGRIVQGRTLNGEGLAGVAVFLVRTSDGVIITQVETDSNGNFEIIGIPAGEYQLLLDVVGIDVSLEGSTFTMDEEGTPLVISAAVGDDGITFAIEEVLGVEDEIALSIYPNPAETLVNVLGKGPLTVRLLSLSGDTLTEKQFVDKTSVDLTTIPHGVYLLEITNNSQQRTVKRVVKMN